MKKLNKKIQKCNNKQPGAPFIPGSVGLNVCHRYQSQILQKSISGLLSFLIGEIALSDFLTVDTSCCHLLGNLRPHLTCLHRQATSGQQMKRKIGNPFSTNLEIFLLKSFETYKTNIATCLTFARIFRLLVRHFQPIKVLKKKNGHIAPSTCALA